MSPISNQVAFLRVLWTNVSDNASRLLWDNTFALRGDDQSIACTAPRATLNGLTSFHVAD